MEVDSWRESGGVEESGVEVVEWEGEGEGERSRGFGESGVGEEGAGWW